MTQNSSLTERFQALCDRTNAGKMGNGQFKGHCPAHDDQTPSLSLKLAEDRILLKCFAGCKHEEILSSMDMEDRHLFEGTNGNPSLNERRVHKSRPEAAAFHEVERYTYKQLNGTPQFVVVRKEATDSKGNRQKDFFQSGFNPDGSLKWNMQGVVRFPYRLPQISKAKKEGKLIIFLEGEKDVHTAEKLGFAATTLPGGARKSGGENLADECLYHLKDADVVLCPDNDEPGIAWQQMIGSKLLKTAKRVRWLQLPELGHKKDFSDWVAKGGNGKTLQALIEQAQDFQKMEDSGEGQQKKQYPKSLSIAELLTMELPERKCLLDPWLPEQGLAMVFAPRGIGKSWFAMQVALSVATGTNFLNWEVPEPRRVLFLDGEMPLAVIQERFQQLVEALLIDPPENLPLMILTPDVQEFGMPDLSSEDGQTIVEPYISEADLVIVDNISTLIRNGRENESDSWVPIQDWALRQRGKRKTILFVHHAGKGGDQRGSSKREDVLDTVISLKRPESYSADEGARFEVHFTKARGFYGLAAEPLDLRLQTNALKELAWTAATLKKSTFEQVVGYLNEGLKQTEIAGMLGISRQAVSKHCQQAKNSGKLVSST